MIKHNSWKSQDQLIIFYAFYVAFLVFSCCFCPKLNANFFHAQRLQLYFLIPDPSHTFLFLIQSIANLLSQIRLKFYLLLQFTYCYQDFFIKLYKDVSDSVEFNLIEFSIQTI